MIVREWMTSPVDVVAPDMEAQAALDLMAAMKHRRLPVVLAGKLVGIVTRGDLESKLGWDRMSWRRLDRRVEDAMTPNPFTVAPEDPVEKAVEVMLQHQISGVPVVEHERIVGIVTETDIFRAFVKVMAHLPATAGH